MKLLLVSAGLFALLIPAPLGAQGNDCKSGRPDTMISACSRIIESSKSGANEKAVAYDHRSWALNAKGSHDRALEDANQALRLSPNFATAFGNRGWAYSGKGDYDRALADYNEALRLDRKLWTVYDLRAWAFGAKGESQRAIADYTEALGLNPRYYVALNGRGVAYTNIGEYDKAISDFTGALALKAGHRGSYSYRAWAYMAKGDYDKALADYKELIGSNPSANNYADRAWVYHLKRDYDGAIVDFDKAIQLAPAFSFALSGRAETYNMKADYDRAIEDADAAVRLDPANKYAYDSRGRALFGKGNYEGALVDFDRSLGVDPTYILALVGRAKTLLAKNDREGAGADLNAAAALRRFRKYEKETQAEAAALLAGLNIKPQPPSEATAIRPLSGRFALLIGNQSYNEKIGPLKNPHNDVTRVSRSLKAVGFRVTEVRDGDFRTINVALNSHIAAVRTEGKAAIGFLYYSGHGAANADTKINYLIPVDAPDADDAQLWHYSIDLNHLVDRLRKEAPATHYVVFDACRNELKLTSKSHKALSQKGFLPLAYIQGSLLAYATAPEMTATDDGLYAIALADEIVRPCIESPIVFMNVARRVHNQIGQNPYMLISAMPIIHFAGERCLNTDVRK